MKYVLSLSAALMLAAYAVPSLASPGAKLISIGPTHVAAISHRPGCDAPASVDDVPFVEVPHIAADQGATGTAQVKIRLTAAGELAASEMFSSSGNPWLDNAALLSARMTRYTAEVANCERVGGTYLYEVDF
ncbi:MAG TPA: TonB family protein [Candidatus Baltobacteraceae bacterium]|nr:TonB family protein [Candidatus Baltobacteraceae bacterium]